MLKNTLLFLLVLSCASAYRVLVAFPYPGKSHSILGEGFVNRLLKGGHEVTYITANFIKNPPKELRQIDVTDNHRLFTLLDDLSFEKVINNEVDLGNTRGLVEIINKIAENTLQNANVQKLMLDTDERFDVVIAEWLYTELYSGFAEVFGCPLIWSSSMDPHGLVLTLIDEDPNPAYTANHMSPKEAPFTFWQRLEELWEVINMKLMKWSIYEYENKVFQAGYGPAVAKRGRQLPSLDVVRHNASLMFGNSHVSAGRAVRLPQNYIPIAGYHINDEVAPLPEDLQKIMDNSPHGVIYFSMGSMIKSSSMPDSVKRGFLQVFGELKQTVIWKFEEILPNLPKNVHILKWAPQPSILAHPNCILFITHGGLLSTTEALHHGVPIIGVPLFADQFINMDRAVRKGFALRVDVTYDTHLQVKAALEEFFRNPKYRERMREQSFIYHHRTVSPGTELLHWVDHVVKTRGAPHLRSPALDVPLYQKMFLDLGAIVLLAVVVLYSIAKRLLCGNASAKKVKKS